MRKLLFTAALFLSACGTDMDIKYHHFDTYEELVSIAEFYEGKPKSNDAKLLGYTVTDNEYFISKDIYEERTCHIYLMIPELYENEQQYIETKWHEEDHCYGMTHPYTW